MPYKDYNNKMNDYMKRRWKERRSKAIQYLGGFCVDCGVDTDLEFDHIDPKTKLMNVARASSLSEERFWAEVDKCALRCGDCHKAKTLKERFGLVA